VSAIIGRHQGAVGSNRQDMLFVSFVFGGMNYGVEVGEVYGIYHGLPIIPTPDSAPSVEGEVQLVDRRVPVVNLRHFAGMNDRQSQAGPHWIVVVDDSRGPVGIVVDGVSEVVKLTPSHMTPSDAPFPGPVGEYVMAVATHEDHPMYLPDFGRLLHDAVQ
jgi:purine-binding chemotaxis protein CheW